MDQFEYQKNRLHIDWKRLMAFIICMCMLLSSMEMESLAAGLKTAAKQAESWMSDNIDSTGYAFVTPDVIPDVTPDKEYEFDACAISRTQFERNIGESVEMKVYAWNENGRLTYTWYGPSNREIEDVTGDTLTIPELKDESEYGRYRCVVKDGASEKNVKVYFRVRKRTSPLFITAEKHNYRLCMGETAVLSVEAADYGSESQNITYQWFEGANAIPGENEKEYTVKNVMPNRKYKKYYCIASNGKTEVKEKITVSSMGPGFRILNDYAVKNGKSGEEITLKAEIEEMYSSPRFSYQWYKGYILLDSAGNINSSKAEIIEGETSDRYAFLLTDDTAGVYSCVVSDEYARLICQQQVKIAEDDTSEEIQNRYYVEIETPDGRTTYPGAQNISMHAVVKSYNSYPVNQDNFTYHWVKGRYKGNREWDYIPLEEERFTGIDTDTLIFRTVLPEDYDSPFICIVTSGETKEQGIEDLYWSGIRCYGRNSESVSVVTERGEGRYLRIKPYAPEEDCVYQWYHNGKQIAGANENAYFLRVEGKEDFGIYSCEVTVNGYTEHVRKAKIYIKEKETLTALAKKSYRDCRTKRVDIGETVDMGVAAYTSAGTLTYQWQVCTASNPQTGEYQFEDIPGETEPDYRRRILTDYDYGTYRCKVACPETDMERYVSYGIYPLQPQTEKIAVTGVTLSRSELKLARGSQAVLTASIMPFNATNKSVIWSSDNPKIATVDGGIVTAVEKGDAVITAVAVDGKKTALCKVSVTVPAEQVFLLKNMNIKKGDSCILRATVLPADSTDQIAWTSSNEKAVTVSDDGKVNAIGTGTAQITAISENGKRAVCTVKVLKKEISASKVKMKKPKIFMKAGDVRQIQASVTPKKSTDHMTWISSNRKTAQVDENGVVTAKRSGKVKITVKTKNGKKDVCEIVITQAAQSIELNKTSLTLKLKKSIQLKAKMLPKGATDRLTWKSSAKKIVSVDKKGKITAQKKGKAVITVKTSSGKTAECAVTVK